ncbi:MAG: dienelactone hydrolase family protein [Bacteroidales bacterium]
MENIMKDLYNDYRKGVTSRRDFLKKLTALAGSTAAAMALIPVLEENWATGDSSAGKAPELVAEYIKYQGFNCEMRAYMARPGDGKKHPAVIVIHENRGLVPHIQDVTRRMASEGFVALAPDALSPVGGTPEDITNVGELFKKLVPEETTKNFVAAVKYLKTNPNTNGKVGCTGFCWGGAMTNQVAVNSPDLDAAVPYYGRQPAADDVAKIKAPLLAHYAGDDKMINDGIPAFEEALKKAGKEYTIYSYPGTQHAFNNDSNPARYNKEAATLAWGRTIAFFREKLE